MTRHKLSRLSIIRYEHQHSTPYYSIYIPTASSHPKILQMSKITGLQSHGALTR